MQCFKEVATDFFHKKRALLEQNYPGITLKNLLDTLESLSFLSTVGKDEYLESAYLPEQKDQLHYFFSMIERGVPLAYISEKRHFYQSDFYVNENVLIPRFETELLVEEAIKVTEQLSSSFQTRLSIADVGTGSGAIILSLLREIKVAVDALATDISPLALDVAKRNAFSLRFTYSPESNLEFLQTDRLAQVRKKFHLIVSNPPYIMLRTDRADVHHQVLNFEPHLALFLQDEHYFEWFETYFRQLEEVMISGGAFLMEGHENHLAALASCLSDRQFEKIELLKDLTGRERILKAYRK